jgi:glycosyltransferase involved in cell wall biosynthesis
MRIAQLAPPWFTVPPAGYGGIEWVVAHLADGLVEAGHDVTLYASGGSVTKAELVSAYDEPLGAKFIGQSFYEARHAVRAFLDADRFDVIHDHTGIVGLAIGAFSGRRITHTLHGPFTDDMKVWYRSLSGRAWFVAISEAQRSFCPDLSYGGVVHNGIDLAHYPLRESKEDFLLFVGRANREKGPEIAVDVARRTGKRLVMVMKIAEDFEVEYWRDVVEPHLTGDEEILGEITVKEKANLMSRARALLFPIQWPEPFGLVMTEAMACGTPVISFPKGAAPEVIADGETGYLVNTIDEMVEAISRLDRIDPHACRARVAKLFSAQAMVAGYERVYERVLSEPAP